MKRRLVQILAAAALLTILVGAGVMARRFGLEEASLKQLESPDPSTRIQAIRALAELRSKKAVSPIVKRMEYADFSERLACLQALASIRPEANNELVAVIVRSGNNLNSSLLDQRLQIRSEARSALKSMGPEVVSPLLRATMPLVEQLEEKYLDVLAHWIEPSVSTLFGMLEGADVSQQAPARWILAHVASKDPGVLRNRLHDSRAWVQQEACTALSMAATLRVSSPPEALRMMAFLESQENPRAARLLSAMGMAKLAAMEEASIRTLVMRLSDQEAFEFQLALTQALGGSRAAEAVPWLLRTLRGDPELRTAAGKALADIGPPAVEPLLALLADPDPQLQMWGWMTLADVAGKHPSAVEQMVQALPRLDPAARSQLARAFDFIGERARAALRAAVDGGDPDLQNAARSLLEELRQRFGDEQPGRRPRKP
jgi:HEAT repeat protein